MNDGLNFSRIIAGCMTWGIWGKGYDTQQMSDLIHHCLASGISTFDHADIYGDYTTEAHFGAALKKSGIAREQIQLVTKCGIQMTRGRSNKVQHYQYDTDYIIASAEQSLVNLNTEYLDLFLLHRPSPLMHPDEIADAITRLKKEGKIKSFGVSNFSASQIAFLDKEVKVDANQVQFALTHLAPMYDGTFDDGLTHTRTMMAWSPLGDYFNNLDKARSALKRQVQLLAEKYDTSESNILLSFILKHPCSIYPVIGTTAAERLTESASSVQVALELQDWFLLLEAAQGHRVP